MQIMVEGSREGLGRTSPMRLSSGSLTLLHQQFRYCPQKHLHHNSQIPDHTHSTTSGLSGSWRHPRLPNSGPNVISDTSYHRGEPVENPTTAMGALLSLPVSFLNLLLPFTNPNTPLAQDLVHTSILCGTLYYAPQIAEWYNTRQTHDHAQHIGENEDIDQPGPDAQQGDGVYEERIAPRENIPLDERLVLQPSDDEDDLIPPPLAPTPPHNHQDAHAPPLPQGPAGDNEDPFAAGPANPNPNAPRNTAANRTVGAKKAKSLARKDQRRAYHEFHRQEAELRRLREGEGKEEREAELAAERERRARIEADIAAKEREERARRKEEERKEAEEESERRERVVSRVRREVNQRGCVDLLEVARKEGKDRMWVVKLVKASGVLAQLGGEGRRVLITGDAWLVRVDEEIMTQAYRDAEAFGAKDGGRVGFEELGGFMERAVRARAKA